MSLNIQLKQTLTCVLIFLFPLTYLNVRHGVHISLYGLFLLALCSPKAYITSFYSDKKWVIIGALALSSLFIATITSQLLQLNFHFAAFDGPSRLLIAGLVLIYLCQQPINYYKILEVAIPIALISLSINLYIHSEYSWNGRWANYFVDPNTLGSQAAILTGLCILSIRHLKSSKLITSINMIGCLVGILVTTKAQSRGGLIVLPAVLLTWLLATFYQKLKDNKLDEFRKSSVIALAGLLALMVLGLINDTIQNRTLHTHYEIQTWIKDPSIYTSAGARLSMWVVSLQLINENWFGYGEINIKAILQSHPLTFGIHAHGVRDLIFAGPHSDILSKGLSLGLLGVLSYLATILIPLYICWKALNHQDKDRRDAALMGTLYIVGVFVTGLFNEMLSLKYLCSFYGLMIISILSIILGKTNEQR